MDCGKDDETLETFQIAVTVQELSKIVISTLRGGTTTGGETQNAEGFLRSLTLSLRSEDRDDEVLLVDPERLQIASWNN